MTALLTADTAAVLSHVLINILIADSGLSVTDTLLIESLVETKVGHNCGDNSII